MLEVPGNVIHEVLDRSGGCMFPMLLVGVALMFLSLGLFVVGR